MTTIKRHISDTVLDLSEQFPVIMVTGARQVGKTTLLRTLSNGRSFVTLDDPIVRELAQSDPALFMQRFRPPILIDEFQYAPGLLPYIKMAVDAQPDLTGQFWLTGSQQFRMMKDVGESLAGRVGILSLGGITQQEEAGLSRVRLPWEIVPDSCCSVPDHADTSANPYEQIYSRILLGSFPAVVSGKIRNLQAFFGSYLNTYIERDVRNLGSVSDLSRFHAFMRVMASRTGNLLNLSDVAKDVGISQPTARSWLSILESSGIVYLLRPYSTNLGARAVKTPKFYFLDTGLCCHLTGWMDVRTLADGAMNGAMLETFVVAEFVRSFWNMGLEPRLWFYRDKSGTEIDILVERNGVLTPFEVKRTASPSVADVRGFSRVRDKGLNLAPGFVVCLATTSMPLPGGSTILPIVNI